MQPDNPFAAPLSLVADPSGSSGAVSSGVVETLRRTRGWVRLMSILGFIGAGFMVLAALGLGMVWTVAPSAARPVPLPVLIGYSGFLAAMGFLYVVPCVRLHKYASGITRLEARQDAGTLEYALDQQRAFWRFVGLTAIVLLVLYALFFVAAIGLGIFGALRGGA
jgi:hypothetical protein